MFRLFFLSKRFRFNLCYSYEWISSRKWRWRAYHWSQVRLCTYFIFHGIFKEALSIVNPIQHELLSPKLKVEYFLGQATIYNHQKNFASSEIESRKNDLIEQTYRDSLLQCAEVPSNIRAFTIAPILLHKKKYNDAIYMLDSAYLSYPQYSRNAGILAYSLASAYQGKGDSKNAIKYFAISAISDAISGTRENRSLRILAKLIFESGDIDRAYTYMKMQWKMPSYVMPESIQLKPRICTSSSTRLFKRKKNANLLLLVAYSVRCALSVSYYLYFSPN